MTTDGDTENRECADLLEALATHRSFLRQTVGGLTDQEAAERTTVSELCLGGIIKHVTSVERGWATFIVQGPDPIGSTDQAALDAHEASFRMGPGETLAELLDRYQEVAEQHRRPLGLAPLRWTSHRPARWRLGSSPAPAGRRAG